MADKRNNSSKKEKFITEKEAYALCGESKIDEWWSRILIDEASQPRDVNREILEKNIKEKLAEEALIEKEEKEYQKEQEEIKKNDLFYLNF
jgi:hypothetical protein